MNFQERLTKAKSHLSTLSTEFEKGHNTKQRVWKDYLLNVLREAADTVEEASQKNVDDLPQILETAEVLIDECLSFAYVDEGGDGNLFDKHISSFAHTRGRPLLQVAHGNNFLSKQPWNETLRFHPKSTACARFMANVALLPAPSTPVTLTIFQARCEVSTGDTSSASGIYASPSGNCIMLPTQRGWKEQIPFLSCYFPGNEASDRLRGTAKRLDLAGLVYHGAVDDESGLLFVGDKDRVKSYSWRRDATQRQPELLHPVHTLKSARLTGEIGMLPNGRVARAGSGKIGIWKLADLPTHGPTGSNNIGGEIEEDIYGENAWRDDDGVECSVGSPAHSTITLPDKTCEIDQWHPHPSSPGSMITSNDPHRRFTYHCRALDLERGGVCTARYLGHGGEVNEFSTSKGDPNGFVTACADGLARLYDVRYALPGLTIQASPNQQNCSTAVICHPDGIPYMFVSGAETEVITLWDIRSAKAPIYDLATGNNTVVGMVWNEDRNELFAAPHCEHQDRNGYHTDYRKARIPRPNNGPDNEDEDDEYEYEDAGYEDTGQAWPRKGYHDETYFGHIFDSADHRIYRYAFKADPNTSIVPPDGGATASGRGGW